MVTDTAMMIWSHACVQEELAAALFVLFVADVRWPALPRLARTDATAIRGGARQTSVNARPAERPYSLSEHRGAHVRTKPHDLRSDLAQRLLLTRCHYLGG